MNQKNPHHKHSSQKQQQHKQGSEPRPALEMRLERKDKGKRLIDFLRQRYPSLTPTAAKLIIRLDGVWINHIMIRNPLHILRGEEQLRIDESCLPLNAKGKNRQPQNRGDQNRNKHESRERTGREQTNRDRGDHRDRFDKERGNKDRPNQERPQRTQTSVSDQDFTKLVIFEDDHILAINKTFGMEPQNRKSLTLIHKIDKNTSGILLYGKTPEAVRRLTQLFRANTIKKTYELIVKGQLQEKSGTLKNLIAKNNQDNTARIYTDSTPPPKGVETKNAVCHFEVLAQLKHTSRVRARMETDYSHQIRAQFAHIKHPILGDQKYGGVPDSALSQVWPAQRMGLHLAAISFMHPSTGKEMVLEAPLTSDLESLLGRL